MSSEHERIERLKALFSGGHGASAVLVGIGDDAAVLGPSAEPLVWTVDASVEGTHFRRDLLSLTDVGYRATMAAASDLAAMGATPLGLLSALVLPSELSDAELEELVAGQRAAADAIGVAIIGGNLARGSELSITTTALGATKRPVLREGARAGDGIWLAGPVGLAAAGLSLLLEGREITSEAARTAVQAWRRPRARIAEGLVLREYARAAIDVSDGLAQDLGHLARASGLSAVLEEGSFVSDELIEVANELGRSALELSLGGGEDYALVAALAPGETLEGFRRIGWFDAQERGAKVTLRRMDGSFVALDERGYDHFV